MKTILKFIMRIIGLLISKVIHLNLMLKIYNFIYENSNRLLVKFFVRYVDLPPKDFIWKIKLLNGKKVNTSVFHNNPKTQHFALSYRWHSPAINILEKLIVNNFSENGVWIDIGANLGLRSLYALSERKQVFFIEPNKELNIINENRCKLNKFENYQFIERGISNKKGTLEFYFDETSYNSTFESQLIDKLQIVKKETVDIDTLDNIFQDKMNELKEVFVKIDVEGHEFKVIEGGNHFIKTLHPTMLIEINTKGEHFENIISLDVFQNYKVYEVGNFKRGKVLRAINSQQLKYNDFLFVQDSNLIEKLENYVLYS